MADIYSLIITDIDYWNGNKSWAGEKDEMARDAKYGKRVVGNIDELEQLRIK